VKIAETHPATSAVTRRSLTQKLEARLVQRLDELHEGVHGTPDDALAALHALDGGDGDAGSFRERSLIEPEQGSGRPELACSNHR
jgi:hypothetical protein